ncbi:hypothetical protein [Mesobacillus maritimus]|uniref:hypothetical protein n=1 Tax=Mesobacillus maritimus TaxID=1643336 RepID=UPI00384A9BBE
MNQNEPKYISFTNNLNAFLMSTHDYIEHLKGLKRKGENVDAELDNFIQLSGSVSAEFSSVKWVVHDIKRNAWELD